MGYFQITATVTAMGNLPVANPVVLWRPVPSFNSNLVEYQYQFFATIADMNNSLMFKPKDFYCSINDSSLDLTDTANWASMRSQAETLLEAIPEIGDNVTYVV